MSFLSTLGHALSSKTVWGAVALGAVNTLPMIAPYVQGTPVGIGINLALAGFTIYGRIRAKQPLGPIVDDTIAKTVDAVNQLGMTDAPPLSVAGKVAQTSEIAKVVKANPVSNPLKAEGGLHE